MIDLQKTVEREKLNIEESEEEEEEEQGVNLFTTKVYNRLENNYHLSNKKALFWNISEYYKSKGQDPWSALPVTFHIDHGINDPEFKKFLQYFH